MEAENAFRKEKLQQHSKGVVLLRSIQELELAVKNGQQEKTELQEEKDKLIERLSALEEGYAARSQEYLNTINNYQTQWKNLQKSDLDQKVQLIRMFDQTQLGGIQGQETVLTLKEIFGQLKDQFSRDRQYFDNHTKDLKTEQKQLEIRINNLNQEYQGLQQEKKDIEEELHKQEEVARAVLQKKDQQYLGTENEYKKKLAELKRISGKTES
ncbi:hypothetical protein, partial [Endozoicomonas sp.]|uniref:hypothetical protein n=1 Tax=Endozoicomonas sp. TaxID=1892382 RepID=UPI00383B61A5